MLSFLIYGYLFWLKSGGGGGGGGGLKPQNIVHYKSKHRALHSYLPLDRGKTIEER